MAHQAPLYPVSLVVAGRRCLVVGGGPVAARKVEGLLGCQALVTVVAPQVVDAIGTRVSDSLTIETRTYRAGEAGHYRLVVTATGVPAVDHAVAADAEAAGVWVNSADDVTNCTFLLPAVHRDGSVTVAVSTGGASPALAGWIRSRLAEALGPGVADLAELLDEARRQLQQSGRSTESVAWNAILDEQVVPLVRQGKVDEARAALRQAVDGAAT